MEFANLDMICKRRLLENGLPIHWYIENLTHCSSAIRTLTKDSLQIIDFATLPVNSYGAVDLPSDFVDDVCLATPVGGLLQPIPHRGNVNPIRMQDSSGSFIPYTTTETATNFQNIFGFVGNWNFFWNVSDFGEPTGRWFGAPGGTSFGYDVIRKRGQIQIIGASDLESVVLVYVSNGQNASAATQIDWRAFESISAYADWKSSPNANIDQSPEAHTWWNARRHLRANLDELTVTDIKNIIHNAYKATIKN